MKVLVLMSGGIDSSVSAALLKREGFALRQAQGTPELSRGVEVIGAFMKLANLPRFKEAEKRAKRVAKILKIPFYVFDLKKEFKKRIIDYFLEGYKKGITPNPCVVCNKEIKFGLLLEKALSLGADYVATGHYARIKKSAIRNSQSVIYKLLRAKDKEKDQSYFLWMLNQDQLKRILFPIGNLTRKEVENLAKKFKLPVLRAKKSVEICFIEKTINDFLRKHLGEKKGKIVDKEGKVLGEHKGLWFYTIGQRKRIGLSGGPYFVLDKDVKKNLLIVTKNEKDLYEKELICKNINWISGKEPKLPLKVKAKIRYRQNLASAVIIKNLQSTIYNLQFSRPQRAITPGQSVVFYKREEVLGGGIIS